MLGEAKNLWKAGYGSRVYARLQDGKPCGRGRILKLLAPNRSNLLGASDNPAVLLPFLDRDPDFTSEGRGLDILVLVPQDFRAPHLFVAG